MAQTRDAARTRRTLLDAAARSVTTHGAGVSLDVVAREAGVSKGGLMHHFRSKEDLFRALVDDLVDRFAQAVHDRVEPGDDTPGRLLRAYVKVTFDDLERVQDAVEQATLLATLSSFPDIARRAQEQYRHWNQLLAEDGVHPQRVALVVRACDGTSVAPLFEGPLGQEELDATRDMLLALTRDTGPVVAT